MTDPFVASGGAADSGVLPETLKTGERLPALWATFVIYDQKTTSLLCWLARRGDTIPESRPPSPGRGGPCGDPTAILQQAAAKLARPASTRSWEIEFHCVF